MPPRLARLLAIVAAVVLVIGAFALRGSLSGGDDEEGVSTGSGGGSGSASGTEPREPDDGPFQVLCDLDLGEAACDAVEGSALVEEVKAVSRGSVAGLIEGDDGERWDAWLTLDPMPRVLDAERSDAGLLPLTNLESMIPVASSTLAVLTFDGSPLTCADPITWTCLVEPVRPPVSLASLSTSVGAVTTGAGAAALMGGTDFGIGAFEDSPARDSLSDVLREVPSGAGTTTDAQTRSMFQPGSTSAAVTTSGLADLRADTAQGRGRELRTAELAPTIKVGVVLAGLGPSGLDATRALEGFITGQTVAGALAQAGWDGPALLTTGLPDPDVVFAILEELS